MKDGSVNLPDDSCPCGVQSNFARGPLVNLELLLVKIIFRHIGVGVEQEGLATLVL
jgi:hypothetical protein